MYIECIKDWPIPAEDTVLKTVTDRERERKREREKEREKERARMAKFEIESLFFSRTTLDFHKLVSREIYRRDLSISVESVEKKPLKIENDFEF